MRIKATLPSAALTVSGTGEESFAIKPLSHVVSLVFRDEQHNRVEILMDHQTFGLLVLKGRAATERTD